MSTSLSKSTSPQPPLLLRPFLQLFGALNLIVRRQQHQPGLALLALVGVVLAVALVTNASFFSEAVDRGILAQELSDFSRITGRPPFSTNVYVFPSGRNPMTLEQAEEISQHISGILTSEVGLPLRHLGLQVSSGSMILQPGEDSDLYGQDFLGGVSVVYISGVSGQMDIIAGTSLDDPPAASGEFMEVWMHDRLVQEMGVQLGETLVVRFNLLREPIPIRVAGFWRAKDPQAEFWFNNPDTLLKDSLLVRRGDYINFIQPALSSHTREASWYVILDDSQISPRKGASYLAGFQRGQNLISQFIPGVRLNSPPLTPLQSFVQRSHTLTVLLLGYNLPAFGILLYFLVLTSAILARWQRKDTSILVSRGMNLSGVLNLTLIEQLLLFFAGYPLGIGLGMLIARVMGYSTSFLSFTERAPLPVSLEGLSIPLTLLALGVSLVSRLWPAALATRSSVVSEEREWTRPSQGPFWYRYYLDLLLVLPTYYLYQQLAQRGSLAGLVVDRPEDLYRDPLLILVPAFFVVTASLITMRLFSLAMRLIDLLASHTPWLTLHLALRQLGRQSQDYISPLLLVIISLAMGVYTLSMAASLDQWLVDRIYYRNGADYTFRPMPLIEGATFTDGSWIPQPENFQQVDGVLAAARVGQYPARLRVAAGAEIWARFMAIDRLDFPAVAWFRPDFGSGNPPESLGALMNRLALAPNGLLVSATFLERTGLQVGDPLNVFVEVDDTFRVRTDFTIAGVYHYFPTVYEEERLVIVGNMEHLISFFGLAVPHDIWLKLAPDADGGAVRRAIPGRVGISTFAEQDTRAAIAAEQAKLERVGIFGTLSIGFLATGLMAILGLLFYSYASLHERVYRFAVLNAVGLLRRQIVAQVVMEYAFLAFFGSLAGALIGIYASRLFVPFFRFTGEQGTPLPPLLPVIAETQMQTLAFVFAVVIVLAEVITLTWAIRRRLVRIR